MTRRPCPDLGERDALAFGPAVQQDREAVDGAPDSGPRPAIGLTELRGEPGGRLERRTGRAECRVLPAGRHQLLERDYAALGGDPADMAATPANIGSATLSAFVFHRAGQPDPVDLLGAMFVIEGLGTSKAGLWADRLQQSLGLRDDQVSFLRYHADGDEEHFGVLSAALRSQVFDDAAVTRIVTTARVVARLYALQLEELGNV